MAVDSLDPNRLTGLALPRDRLLEVAREFETIRTEIEKLRQLDLGETHPAIVFRPIRKTAAEDR